ncbi:MAG: hypothetical protein NZ898_06975 [Myxococcota bacterium]|nr:hypothetical protein [Myxococcota bacterium]
MQYRVVVGSRFALRFLLLVALPLTACSGRRGEDRRTTMRDADVGYDASDAPAPSGDLRIEPADHVVRLTEGVTLEIEYRAFLGEREVTTESTWSLSNPALGTFTGNRFIASGLAGRTVVIAQMGALRGQTSLTLQMDRVIVDPSAPPGAPDMFGGTEDPSRAPQLVYPDDGVVVPPNMRELEFHYRTGGASVFELDFEIPTGRIRVYFGCPESVGGGCIYTPNEETWDALAAAARGQGPIRVRLSGSDGSRVGRAPAREMTFAEEDITGGLYYWAATSGTIKRYEWGRRGRSAETFIDRARTGAFMCVGCHALSRDGTRIGVGTDIPTTTFQVFDVASRGRIFALGAGGVGFPSQRNFSSFSPDTRQIVQSGLAGLQILDATSGVVVVDRLGGGPASMPDWSPNGRHIVFARHDSPSFGPVADMPGIVGGRLVRLDADGAGGWTVGPTLVETPGQNNYYPAYSPDGEWIVFNRSPSNTNSMGGSDSMSAGVPDAQLWLVSNDGSIVLRLDRADGLADSWPKWDPTAYVDRGQPLFWLSWSSRRAFGLRYGDNQITQLWMAAIRPEEARAGRDPSAAAFRLPFQEIDTGNHIPQWATRIERMTCTTNADCGGEFCIDGRCYPNLY